MVPKRLKQAISLSVYIYEIACLTSWRVIKLNNEHENALLIYNRENSDIFPMSRNLTVFSCTFTFVLETGLFPSITKGKKET